MSLPSVLASPVPAILLKWTALLALSWTAHGLLRRSHARWRLILWRSILCFGLLLPLMRFIPVPGLRISTQGDAPPSTELPDLIGQFSTGDPAQPIPKEARFPQHQEWAGAAPGSASNPVSKTFSASASWKTILMAIWAVGALWAAIRLIRFQMQLSRLWEAARLPAPTLVQLAREIQARLGVLQTVRVRVSEAVASPFVFGLLQPTILLPRRLAQDLTPEEISALLRHEIAHLCRHDLIWGLGWRWMQAACWFHPMVWKIPAAHSLACEQEADRIASQQMENPDSYARFLAQMVLRVLALPPVETTLTMNGNSQIALRLDHIRRGELGPWKWRHSAAGFGLAGVLLLVTVGWEFSGSKSQAV